MANSTDTTTSDDQILTEAAAYKRLYPAEYLERFVAEEVRPDGREKGQWRDVRINVGAVSTANGSALVRLGDTTIVCGIKAEVAEPDWKTPNHGWIVPNLDLPAISSPLFKPGPPAEEAQVFSQQLNDLLVSSNVLPLSTLCIEPKKAAWVLYVDLVCVNYDGNAFDASVLAIMAALRDTKLPIARWDEDLEQAICSRTETWSLRESLTCTPLACTFGIFKGEHLLPDPTAFETPLIDTTITIALDAEDASSVSVQGKASKIRLVRQNGLGGLGGKQSMTGIALLGHCIGVAKERVKAMSGVLYVV
ncbi:hypothetical protein NliqN6_4183 [Naganishia liquefaciens]|uniref:Ribosomal RNA-processing protein 43 n=1 Tax=Naganishia liquefaciens TaxID=104408 RepID=A0A8H3TUH2_9TREE|nr:hypothetical protein NliqN6_4183 [Naganishia liquefaciens]